jgi:hypothetical protein
MPQLPQSVAKGQPVTADMFNALLAEVRRLGRIKGSHPVNVTNGPEGPRVWLGVRAAGGTTIQAAWGKLDETLEQGEEAEVSVWEFDGTEWSDTGENETARDRLLLDGESVEADTWVLILYFADRWWVIAAGCSPDDTTTGDSLLGGTQNNSTGNDDMAFDPIGPGDLVYSGGYDSFSDGNLA